MKKTIVNSLFNLPIIYYLTVIPRSALADINFLILLLFILISYIVILCPFLAFLTSDFILELSLEPLELPTCFKPILILNETTFGDKPF